MSSCGFGENISMLLCNMFKRSFSDKGFGYTFNNEKSLSLFKYLPIQNEIFNLNKATEPLLIESSSINHALTVLIENNYEENQDYESLKTIHDPVGDITIKPRSISVSLHDPKEPANIR